MNRPHLFMKNLFLFIMVLVIDGYSQVDEYIMKAVAIEKLSRYIEWPADTAHSVSDSFFTITVLGKDPFNGILERLYADKLIKNRKVKIRYISSPDDISSPRILYISGSFRKSIGQIIRRMSGKPVLLMGDTPGYAHKGVHMRVYIKKSKIQFEINREEYVRSGLKISSRLLGLAEIVNSE